MLSLTAILATAAKDEEERMLSRQQQQHTTLIPLGTSDYGLHYVELYVGKPPQRQSLLVDTESNISGLTCSNCPYCGGFDERKSESFVRVAPDMCNEEISRGIPDLGVCDMDHIEYEEKNDEKKEHHLSKSEWTAYESHDIAYLGIIHNKEYFANNNNKKMIAADSGAFNYSFRFTFGCETSVRGFFSGGLKFFDGELGMNKNHNTMWGQMYEENIIKHKSFSLCFTNSQQQQTITDEEGNDEETDNTNGGFMTLGGYNEKILDTSILYTSTTTTNQNDDNFYVHIRKIHLQKNGEGDFNIVADGDEDNINEIITLNIPEASLNVKPISIKSSTAYTYLPKASAAQFMNAFYRITGKQYTNDGVMLTQSELQSLPTFVLQLKGDESKNRELYPSDLPSTAAGAYLDPDHPLDVLLSIPPSQYMEHSKGSMVYTARIYMDHLYPPALGANAMMGHNIYFDVEEDRIGWSKSSCSRPDDKKEGDYCNSWWYCRRGVITIISGGIILGSIIIGMFVGIQRLRSNRFASYKLVMGGISSMEYKLQDSSLLQEESSGGNYHELTSDGSIYS